MGLPECCELSEFDPVESIKAHLSIGCRALVHEREGRVVVSRYYPVKLDVRRIQALDKWANKTDPGGSILGRYMRSLWEARGDGEKFVPLCRGLFNPGHLVNCSD